MKRIFVAFLASVLSMTIFTASAAAQNPNNIANDEKCAGAVYKPAEVSSKAKIGYRPEPQFTEEARAHSVEGRVVLTAIMCRTGKITNIHVIESQPFGMTERAIQAASQIKFKPAEKDGQQVSQTIQIEYNFDLGIGRRRALAQEPTGRMVESIEIGGFKSAPGDEIREQIKSRLGESINLNQVQSDLKAILALGYFDTTESYFRIEEGDSGSVRIYFYVKELDKKTPNRE